MPDVIESNAEDIPTQKPLVKVLVISASAALQDDALAHSATPFTNSAETQIHPA